MEGNFAMDLMLSTYKTLEGKYIQVLFYNVFFNCNGYVGVIKFFSLFSMFYWSYPHLQNNVMHQQTQAGTSNKNQNEDWGPIS